MEHLLKIPCTSMPFVCEADYSVTLTPMIHVDRTDNQGISVYIKIMESRAAVEGNR